MPNELQTELARVTKYANDVAQQRDDAIAESARLREVLRAFVPPCEGGSWKRPCKGITTHYRHHADHTTSHYCRRHARRLDNEAAEFKFAAELESLLADVKGAGRG